MLEESTTALLDAPFTEDRYFDDNYELIDGIPTEREMGAVSDRVALRIGGRLDAYVSRTKLGQAYGSQTAYRDCYPNSPKRMRRPDASFVAQNRLPGGHAPDGEFTIAPDLAIEVLSPNDLCEDLEDKLRDYREAGVKLVWVLSPRCKTVRVIRADRTEMTLLESETLSGENIVPGFSVAIAELFD